jgi:uncharacterized protein with PhoU and TrkA domain
MQRAKARFQVLSAITGTGFNTSEAEAIVTPTPGTKVEAGDVLILAGNNDKLEQLLEEARKNREREKEEE